MDEMSILKHTGDADNLEKALERLREEQLAGHQGQGQFYNFEYLAQLFVGHCVKVDGQKYCPHESVHVTDLDEDELAKQHCSIFDDIVICQHDIREAL